MKKIKLYTVGKCNECVHVRRMFEELGIEYQELDVTEDPYRKEVVEKTGCYSVPQVLADEEYVGGYEKIVELYKEKKLKEYLE